jgi:hypothetical protein
MNNSYNVLDGNEGFKQFKVAGDGTDANPFVPIMRLEVTPDVTSVTGWSNPLSDENVASEKIIKETIDNQELTAVSFDSNTGVITFEKEKGDLSVNIAAGQNKFVQSATFDTNNGVLTFTYNDLTTTTVDLDGRYAITLDESIDNQGTTPVTMSTDIDVRVSDSTGWAFQDPTGATDILKIYRDGTTDRISADAFFMTFNNGSTAVWQKGLNIDVSNQGIQIGVDLGTIKTSGILKLNASQRIETNESLHINTDGQTIKIGDANGLIQTDGNLTLETINSNNMFLRSGSGLYFDDTNRLGSGRIVELNISSNQSDWSDSVTKYGSTTSLLAMINEAITNLGNHSVTELNDVTNAGSGEIITTVERNKLAGIQDGAEVNVNSDWNATTGDSEILNKPTDVTDLSTHSVTELSDITNAGSGEIIKVGERTKLTQITVNQPVNLDTMESDIAVNNAKISNATHTGEVTGAGFLTISSDVVDNQNLTNMATGTVKGRVSAGTGDPEDIDIDTDLKTALNLTNSDVGLANVQNVDQTNADNITSGTLASARYNDPTKSFIQDDGQSIETDVVKARDTSGFRIANQNDTANMIMNDNGSVVLYPNTGDIDFYVIGNISSVKDITSSGEVQSLTTGRNSYIARTIGADFVGTVLTEYIPKFANSILSNTTIYSYDNTLGEFTFLKSGIYKLCYSIIGQQVNYNKDVTWRVIVETGTTTFTNNWGEGYGITNQDAKAHLCNITNTAILQVNANQKLRLRVQIAKDDTSFGDTLTGVTIKANSIINIQYLG